MRVKVRERADNMVSEFGGGDVAGRGGGIPRNGEGGEEKLADDRDY